jgi:glutamate dehydrogenase
MNRRSASLHADHSAGEDEALSTAVSTVLADRAGHRREEDQQQPTPTLERLVADAMYMAAATGGSGPELANLVNRYWRLVPDEDLEGRTASRMLAATRAHLDLARQRLSGELKIQVEQTPEHTVLQIVTDDMPFLVDSVTAAITGGGTT